MEIEDPYEYRQRLTMPKYIVNASGDQYFLPDNSQFYFVNSYYPVPADRSIVIASCEYGIPFSAAIASDKLVATQFHLEKSGVAGLRLLDNFCRWQ